LWSAKLSPPSKSTRRWSGKFSSADQRRTGLKHVSAHASTEEGNSEGRGKKVRVLSIPSIRDRVVQGALKLILEPIFEADFQPGSYGYRPKRTAHQAVDRVAKAIFQEKTRVLDLDLRAYFDNVQHYLLHIVKGLYDTLPISRTFLRESQLSVPVIRSKENHSPFLGPSIDTADCISC
jgi:Reverse transcriptase (RNA-dependent DNA polymerase)